MGCVYSILCCPTQKLYIGKTTQNLRKYIKNCVSSALRGDKSKPRLYKALREHGPQNFKVTVLFESDSEETLLGWEKYLIQDMMTVEHGLNASSGGQGVCRDGKSAPYWSEEQRSAARSRLLILRATRPEFNNGGEGARARWAGHVKNVLTKKTPEEIRKGVKQGKGETSSEFVGVRWEPDRQKWLALIWANQKRHHLGRFKTELEAAAAYDNAAKRLLGIGPINIKETIHAI